MKRIYFYLCAALLFAMASCKSNGGSGSKDSLTTAAVPNCVVKYTRYNVLTKEGQQSLAAMQKAFDIIRKLDCSDTRSWYYQGGIHWIPAEIPGGNPLCPSYQHIAQLKKAWDNCTHFYGSRGMDHGYSINFLLWHRLYIYHLESIVRKLSGDNNFALPYWGYTDTVNVTANRTLDSVLRKN